MFPHRHWNWRLVGKLPELPQDILQAIFATLEIPDLVRAGSVCSSWRAAYTSLRELGQYKQSQTPCLFYTSESVSIARIDTCPGHPSDCSMGGTGQFGGIEQSGAGRVRGEF